MSVPELPGPLLDGSSRPGSALLRAVAADVLATPRDFGLDPPPDGPVLDQTGLLGPRRGVRRSSYPPEFSGLHRALWSTWRASLWAGGSLEGARERALSALDDLFASPLPSWSLTRPGVLDPSTFSSPAEWAGAEWRYAARSGVSSLVDAWSASVADLLASPGNPALVLAVWDGADGDVLAGSVSARVLAAFDGVSLVSPSGPVAAAVVPEVVSRWVTARRTAFSDPPLRAFSLPGLGVTPVVLDTFARLWDPCPDSVLSSPTAARAAAVGVLSRA